MCRYRPNSTMYSRGFTLVELIVTIGIIGIMLSMATFGYNQWMVKNNVTAQVRQMVTDIGELRVRAMTMRQRHSITFTPTSYVFRSYSTDTAPLEAGEIIPGGTHTVKYRLQNASKADVNSSVRYEIDTRGMLQSLTTSIFLDYNGSATLDCFKMHTIRVNPGKKNAAGDKCDEQ